MATAVELEDGVAGAAGATGVDLEEIAAFRFGTIAGITAAFLTGTTGTTGTTAASPRGTIAAFLDSALVALAALAGKPLNGARVGSSIISR